MKMKNCFIISPIGEVGSEIRNRADEILAHIIKPILKEFDYTAIRADEISEFGLITNQVIEHIVYDDLVICDMTSRNPNVYYELAIRHVVQKPIIQLIDENEELPFDVINTRTIKINHRSLSGADKAKEKIKEYLKKIDSGVKKIETPTSSVIDLDVALFDKSPISNLNIAYSKIYELLKGTQHHFNNPLNIMSQEYINLISEVDRLKSSFLANLSHEIRTPINGLIGFTEIYTSDDIKPDERKEYGIIINKIARQIMDLMDNLLDLSFIETNQIKLHITNQDIGKLLDETIQYHKHYLIDNKSKISLNLQKSNKSSLVFSTDHHRLSQIISILIENAIKFTDEGNIVVAYELENKEFHFTVNDTGIGIESKDYSVIFEKFKQVYSNKTHIYSGNGIGLSIAKGLVEKLGGRIWLESKINVGTTFYMTIPELAK